MVMVFDEGGEQIPGYQGQYKLVRENILIDALLGALFMHDFAHTGGWREIPREEW
jgi:hypothetical protein